MFYFRMIFNSLKHSKGRKFLTFLTIFLSVGLISAMLNLTLKIGDQAAKELRSYGSNIIVLPSSSTINVQIGGENFSPLDDEDFLQEKHLHKIKEIFWRNNIVAYAPFLNVKSSDFDVVGTYFDKILNVEGENDFKSGIISLYPFAIIDGKTPKDDDLSEILIGENLSKTYKIGDKILLGNFTVKIVGILKGVDELANSVISSLILAQNLSDKLGLIQKIEVSAMTIPENDLSLKARRDLESLDAVSYDKWYCSAYASSIAYQIAEEYPNATAKAVLGVSETQSEITKKIQNLMGVVTILSLLVSAICVMSLLSSEIFARKKEIGLLKALGASNTSICMQFLGEILFIAVIASFFGVGLGYVLSTGLSYQIFSSFISFSIMVLWVGLVFGILICLIGSILALRGVIKLLPAEVLYGRK